MCVEGDSLGVQDLGFSLLSSYGYFVVAVSEPQLPSLQTGK